MAKVSTAFHPNFADSIVNEKGDKWGIDDLSVDDLLIPLGMHTSTQVTADGKSMIYLIGGCSGIFQYTKENFEEDTAKEWPWKCTIFSKYVLAYNPYTDSYRTLAQMPIGKYGHTAVEVDGKIWVIGGRSRQNVDDSSENVDGVDKHIDVYDIATDSWQRIEKNFEKATASGASFSLESGSLYYAGGFDDAYVATNEVVKINTRTFIDSGLFEFESVASMQVARGMLNAVTINNMAVIAGGTFEGYICSALESVEEYNPYEKIRHDKLWNKNQSKPEESENQYDDVWVFLKELTDNAGSVSMINLNGQILAFTGVRHCSQGTDQDSFVQALDWKDTNSEWYYHGYIKTVNRFYFSTVPLPEVNAALIFGGTTFYDKECNCMKTLGRVSAYYTSDAGLKVKQGQKTSGVAVLAICLWTASALLLLVYFSIKVKSKPPETVINQEGVSSLPGAEGIVEDANKDLGLVKNGKENEREVIVIN
eukprot:CAMPEP_0194327790 /NCGR_PEP_ID=MMETSP0171-20130528/42462_1 /TAXON_ID=218684 /ORGANISM="Corethron pennatum, Strain L29A3" /LENGTH=478 /DNA_ID=CAMNT_0039087859 /DNA_START=98 /DNA_END=1530 /DNA_ORIENTATION=-